MTQQSELTLHQLLRCRHVRRWHIVRTGREQSVAEHQWAVFVITEHLADKLGLHLGPDRALMMMNWALLHDTTETVMGDMPTPVSEAVGGALQYKERRLSERWYSLKEWALLALDGVPAEVVKMADVIEAISFLDDDAVGEHAARVRLALIRRLDERVEIAAERWPSYPWKDAAVSTLIAATVIEGDNHD